MSPLTVWILRYYSARPILNYRQEDSPTELDETVSWLYDSLNFYNQILCLTTLFAHLSLAIYLQSQRKISYFQNDFLQVMISTLPASLRTVSSMVSTLDRNLKDFKN